MVSHSLARIFSQRSFSRYTQGFLAFSTEISFSNVIKQLVHAYHMACVRVYRVMDALGKFGAYSNSYASLVLSKLPAYIHNSIYAR